MKPLMPFNMADGEEVINLMWNGTEIIYTYCKEKDGYNIKIRSSEGTERIYGFRTRTQLIEGDKFNVYEAAIMAKE